MFYLQEWQRIQSFFSSFEPDWCSLHPAGGFKPRRSVRRPTIGWRKLTEVFPLLRFVNMVHIFLSDYEKTGGAELRELSELKHFGFKGENVK